MKTGDAVLGSDWKAYEKEKDGWLSWLVVRPSRPGKIILAARTPQKTGHSEFLG